MKNSLLLVLFGNLFAKKPGSSYMQSLIGMQKQMARSYESLTQQRFVKFVMNLFQRSLPSPSRFNIGLFVILFLGISLNLQAHKTVKKVSKATHSCNEVPQKIKNYYIDDAVTGSQFIEKKLANINTTKNVYSLFSHGRSGELLMKGQWKNAQQIAAFLEPKIQNSKFKIQNSKFKYLWLRICERRKRA